MPYKTDNTEQVRMYPTEVQEDWLNRFLITIAFTYNMTLKQSRLLDLIARNMDVKACNYKGLNTWFTSYKNKPANKWLFATPYMSLLFIVNICMRDIRLYLEGAGPLPQYKPVDSDEGEIYIANNDKKEHVIYTHRGFVFRCPTLAAHHCDRIQLSRVRAIFTAETGYLLIKNRDEWHLEINHNKLPKES